MTRYNRDGTLRRGFTSTNDDESEDWRQTISNLFHGDETNEENHFESVVKDTSYDSSGGNSSVAKTTTTVSETRGINKSSTSLDGSVDKPFKKIIKSSTKHSHLKVKESKEATQQAAPDDSPILESQPSLVETVSDIIDDFPLSAKSSNGIVYSLEAGDIYTEDQDSSTEKSNENRVGRKKSANKRFFSFRKSKKAKSSKKSKKKQQSSSAASAFQSNTDCSDGDESTVTNDFLNPYEHKTEKFVSFQLDESGSGGSVITPSSSTSSKSEKTELPTAVSWSETLWKSLTPIIGCATAAKNCAVAGSNECLNCTCAACDVSGGTNQVKSGYLNYRRKNTSHRIEEQQSEGDESVDLSILENASRLLQTTTTVTPSARKIDFYENADEPSLELNYSQDERYVGKRDEKQALVSGTSYISSEPDRRSVIKADGTSLNQKENFLDSHESNHEVETNSLPREKPILTSDSSTVKNDDPRLETNKMEVEVEAKGEAHKTLLNNPHHTVDLVNGANVDHSDNPVKKVTFVDGERVEGNVIINAEQNPMMNIISRMDNENHITIEKPLTEQNVQRDEIEATLDIESKIGDDNAQHVSHGTLGEHAVPNSLAAKGKLYGAYHSIANEKNLRKKFLLWGGGKEKKRGAKEAQTNDSKLDEENALHGKAKEDVRSSASTSASSSASTSASTSSSSSDSVGDPENPHSGNVGESTKAGITNKGEAIRALKKVYVKEQDERDMLKSQHIIMNEEKNEETNSNDGEEGCDNANEGDDEDEGDESEGDEYESEDEDDEDEDEGKEDEDENDEDQEKDETMVALEQMISEQIQKMDDLQSQMTDIYGKERKKAVHSEGMDNPSASVKSRANHNDFARKHVVMDDFMFAEESIREEEGIVAQGSDTNHRILRTRKDASQYSTGGPDVNNVTIRKDQRPVPQGILRNGKRETNSKLEHNIGTKRKDESNAARKRGSERKPGLDVSDIHEKTRDEAKTFGIDTFHNNLTAVEDLREPPEKSIARTDRDFVQFHLSHAIPRGGKSVAMHSFLQTDSIDSLDYMDTEEMTTVQNTGYPLSKARITALIETVDSLD